MQLALKPLNRVVTLMKGLRPQIVPKINLRLEKGSYIVKTVSEPWEFQEVIRLRYAVFHREYRKAILPFGWDLDDYDFICDHLIIIQKNEASAKKEGTVVGTYRMICSTFSESFYSQTEFNLDEFLKLPGVKLELGRACIHPDYRKGSVMNLLWRGVTEYLKQTDARYLFGCSSVKVMDAPEVADISRYLENKGFVSEEYGIRPLPNWEVPALDEHLAKAYVNDAVSEAVSAVAGDGATAGVIVPEDTKAKELLPPLLEMYLLAGAKVVGRPALDRDFRCVDYLTVLDTTKLSALFSRRYSAT